MDIPSPLLRLFFKGRECRLTYRLLSKFVDPDGLLAERAFDLAIAMREWGSVLPDGDLLRLGCHRCRLLAEFSGIGEQAIWEWSLVQCVSNGMLLKQIGFADPASVEFAMAEAWAAG